ncbi:MAG: hypothetical protein ACHQ1D_06920 [Nitrososphaerales archaeon]
MQRTTQKMEHNITKNIQSKLKALGLYQIAGGVIGLGLTVWVISGLTTTTLTVIVLLFIAIALYAYSVYCGTLLLKQNVTGLKPSLINQYLQLIGVSFFGFGFQYISGVSVLVGLDLTDSFLITFNLGISQWQITINDHSKLVTFNFNLVALFLILFIEKLKKEIRKDQLERQIRSIGQ